MGRVVVIGGGIVGTCAAMMLANDGHEVTVLERDAAMPAPPDTAWDTWERRGVNQFRLPHYLLPKFREIADAELPGLTDALAAAGALRGNAVADIPADLTGGWRDGDEWYDSVTARRPLAEAVVAAMAATTVGLTIRRGVAVAGVLALTGTGGIIQVTGVRTVNGEEIVADLVVDAGGRRSAMGEWLRAVGSPGPEQQLEDSGFVYYGRHFRSADGSIPPAFGGLLQPYGSITILTLPADNGTWGVVVAASAKDAALRALSGVECWDRVLKGFPLVAHWTDGEPLTGVDVMAKIEDRVRTYVVDGVPVASGVVPLGDAWACTNPSLGRGVSIGMVHAAALRSLLRHETFDDPLRLACRWAEVTAATVQPMYDDTLAFDRHRLAEIEATIEGRPYETDDPGWLLGQALANSVMRDPEMLRGFMDIATLRARGVEVLSRPGVAEKAIALADSTPPPGPNRAELLALIGA